MAVKQWVNITEKGVDKTNNTSTVIIQWYSKQDITPGQSESSHNNSATGDIYIRFNRNGEKAEGTGDKYNPYPIRSTYKLEPKTTNLLKTLTLKVPHRYDGTGSIFVYTWMNTETTSKIVKTTTYKELTSIPRPADITSAKNVVLGDKCEVKWTPTRSTFKNRIRFAGSDSGVWEKSSIYDTWYGDGTVNDGETEFDVSKNISPNQLTEYTFNNYTFSKDLANKYPNSAEGKFVAYLTTYDQNDQYIGVGKSKEFKFSLPPDIKPTISGQTVAPNNSSFVAAYAKNDSAKQAIWQDKGISGMFFSGFSTPIFKAKANGSYSSKITNFKIGYNPATMQGYGGNIKIDNPSSEENLSYAISEPVECNLSEEFTTLKWTVSAIDSRQRSSESFVQTYKVYNYKPPTVSLQDASRDSDNKKKAHVKFFCNYRSLDKKNTPTIIIKWQKKETSTWASYTFPFTDLYEYCTTKTGSLPEGVTLLLGYNGEGSKAYSFGESGGVDGFYCDYLIPGEYFDESSGYKFKIEISDLITNTESSTEDITTKMVLMDFRHGGKGLAVGKMAETDSFEIALPLSIEGGIRPTYLTEGSNLFNQTTSGIYVGSSISSMTDSRTYTDDSGTIKNEEITKSPTEYYGANCFLLEVLPLYWSTTSGSVTHVYQRLTIFIANRSVKFSRCIYGGSYANQKGYFSEWCDDGDSHIDPRAITGVSAHAFYNETQQDFLPIPTTIEADYTVIPINTELGFLKSDKPREGSTWESFEISEDRRVNSSYFEIENNGITCLDNGFVQVSANIRAVCASSSSNGLILGGIFLKPTGQSKSYLMGGLSSGVLQSGFVCLSIPVFTIKVNSGDILQLEAKKLNSSVPETTTLGGDCTMTVSYL